MFLSYAPCGYAGRYFSNPNLLDNWYFERPVNQRGLTNYPADAEGQYCIDRWRRIRLGVEIAGGG